MDDAACVELSLHEQPQRLALRGRRLLDVCAGQDVVHQWRRVRHVQGILLAVHLDVREVGSQLLASVLQRERNVGASQANAGSRHVWVEALQELR